MALSAFSALKLIGRNYIQPEQTERADSQNIEISDTDPSIKPEPQSYNLEFKNDTANIISVYALMQKLRDENKLTFTEKNYAGLGEFITSIGGVKNSTAKNWIYYVNGKKAEVGVSNYQLKPGDVVSWKYEAEIY